MFQKLKEVRRIVFLGLVIVFLAGCSMTKDKDNSEKGKGEKDKSKETSLVTTPDLPEASGKISDITDSLSVAISGENDIISQSESSAKNAITDSQETSDFSQVYNENEF